MTLLVLSYPSTRDAAARNSPEMLDAHLEHIAASYSNVLPGDPLPPRGIAVCLCFEGPTFDFRHSVLPLLEKHAMRALLAISPGIIRNDPALGGGVVAQTASAESGRNDNGCTWDDLQEIARSGRVALAAAGYSGRRLDVGHPDLETEIHAPRTLLSTRLRLPVESFVFPHGRWHRAALREVRTGYRFAFAMENAANVSWDHAMLFAIRAGRLQTPLAPFDPARRFAYRLRGWSRRLW